MSKETKELIPSGLTYIAENIISKQNILGAPKKEKAKWASGIKFSESKETIFFAGCGYQYSSALDSMMSLIRTTNKSFIGSDFAIGIASALQKKVGIDVGDIYRKLSTRESENEAAPLRDAVKVLQSFGIELGYLGEEEPCCGALLYYTGLRTDFSRNAQATYEKLKSFGVKRIISMVPSCTYALKALLPSSVPGYDLEVKHLAQIILERMQPEKLRFPTEVKVVYHDPCQLGRYLGIVEEPRKILNSIRGVELVEPDWTKGEWSTCCGGGGGFEIVFPEISQMLAVRRVEELVKTGAEVIVTACPGCILQLREGLKELKVENIEVLDLAEVVARAMEV